MPVQVSYPGVYIEEVPSGVRTITGVATSIAAFIGRAARGPVNEPITINSFGDFERIFGGLWQGSTLGFAVRDFYLNGGSQAIIVRLFGPVFKDESERQSARQAAQGVADAAAQKAAEAGASPTDVSDAARTKADEFTDEPQKTAADIVAMAAEAAAGKSGATVDTVKDAAAAAIAKATPLAKARIDANGLQLKAAYEGAWGNALRARIDHDVTSELAERLGIAQSELFNLSIRDTTTGVTEVFRNVTVVDSPRRIDNILENESSLMRVLGALPTSIPSNHAESPEAGKTIWDDNTPATNSKVADADKASDGRDLEEDDFTGQGKEAAKQGLFALEKADLFNLLCLPPYKNDGNVDTTLIARTATYCEKRRAMLLVDAPSDWTTKDQAKNGISAIGRHKNAAIFFPRLKQPNPLRDNQVEEFVPCGAVAGVIARTDVQRGVWKAPAGLEAILRGVSALSVPLTDAENGELNRLGINCLRTMPSAGHVIWGARTLLGDDRLASEWKAIPVRRMALHIKETLFRSTLGIPFEPNDEPLWAQIRLNVGAFMQTLFRQGAFQGRTPQEAYFVKCDSETTTQTDINNGIVNILVGFAPLKPAEFVIIKIQQIAGQIEV